MSRAKIFKYLSFGTATILVMLLIAASLLEKLYGTAAVQEHIYGARSTAMLWTALVLFSLCYLVQRGMHRRKATFALHLSFAVILLGAGVTWSYGIQGRMHLRVGESCNHFYSADGAQHLLPFTVTLDDFTLSYHKGTFAPMDYISHLHIEEPTQQHDGRVSMNKILSYRHYRLYQAGYDKDGKGSTLSISYDPWGIGITYAGYLLLLLSMVTFLAERRTSLRMLLRHPALKRGTMVLVALGTTLTLCATERPPSVSRSVGEAFGDLHVYHNDRICPLQTLAKDFTTKLCGSARYWDYTSEQVMLGWLLFYDEWHKEPMIKIKGGYARELLHINGPYARLTDFVDGEGYRLDEGLRSATTAERPAVEQANEKFNIATMLCTGQLLRIYPCRDTSGVRWYAPSDALPEDMPTDQRLFITHSMRLVAEYIMNGEEAKALSLLDKIQHYQRVEAQGVVPPVWRHKAEKLYNSTNINRPLAIICLLAGIALSLYICLRRHKSRHERCLKHMVAGGAIAILLYLTAQIALRWIVSGHVPLSNGFETMQFMAWCSLLLTLTMRHRVEFALPFGYIICGCTLLVAMMGEASPRITQLMPVLQSPLLSIHVVVIMVAYALLAFTMLNGVAALIIRHTRQEYMAEVEYLQVVSRIVLYPAIFLLSIGIFIGAVWANISWGRYWGWDPKEVWALITMLLYAAAVHSDSLTNLRRPMFFHAYMVAAFLSVLITYFGVNFLLGGMHAYA